MSRKSDLIASTIGWGYVVLVVSLFVAAIWTKDWEWAATGVILILPSVILTSYNNRSSR
jgi:Zn-dependent protease with chaperone function